MIMPGPVIDDDDEDLGHDDDFSRRVADEASEMEEVEKGTHFASLFVFFFLGGMIFLRPSMAHSFLLCVVEGRGVALTPGVELPGVGSPGAGVSALALAP